MNVEHLVHKFRITGAVEQVSAFGSGHINDTFRITNQQFDQPDYLLQRINHQVFKEVAIMMDNIRKVTEYIKARAENGCTLELIPTHGGQYYYLDTEGNYWRMYIFMNGLMAYDVAQTPEQIYEGAKTFGNFLTVLSDFPVGELSPTIPDFHNVIKRLEAFRAVVSGDKNSRVKLAIPEINYVRTIAGQMSTIEQLGNAGRIPLRVTHNDTKFNNVLLDEQGIGRCVIDLDTVMPGYVHYDFGDGIRTTVSNAAEDEAELDNIQVDVRRYRAFAEGYLEATHTILTATEIAYLPLSGAMMAFIMGLRFLTDFLAGDIYYKTHFDGQNLQRARAQLNLTRKLLARLPELKELTDRALQRN